MFNSLTKVMTLVAGLAVAPMAYADTVAENWLLDGGQSQITFGSVKSGYIGEVHSFKNVNGTVSKDGVVKVEIDLASVETGIEKRNARLIKHVFKGMGVADLKTQIDMDALTQLAVGDMTTLKLEGSLSLVGTELDLDVPMVVVRLAEDRVMAMTDTPIFLDTDEAGIDAGINKLMELASLDSITRSVPVTLRFVFEAESSFAAK